MIRADILPPKSVGAKRVRLYPLYLGLIEKSNQFGDEPASPIKKNKNALNRALCVKPYGSVSRFRLRNFQINCG
jgi:hypothetical protein